VVLVYLMSALRAAAMALFFSTATSSACCKAQTASRTLKKAGLEQSCY
jgi:hypothetical protein